jgi:hypothetical protein
MAVGEEDRMILSARFEASADTPGQVQSYFHEAFRRLGLGLGDIPEGGEVYERTASGGYNGRIKVNYGAPMNAAQENVWFAGGEVPWENTEANLASRLFGYEPSTRSTEASAEEILDNIRRLANVVDVEVTFDHTQRDGSGWRVNVTFEPGAKDAPPMTLSVGKPTLREAALDAYGSCGVEVVHYDTSPA